MLAGKPPFKAHTVQETFRKILKNEYTPLLYVSKDARKLINQILEPNFKFRISVNDILRHAFFSKGWIPDKLNPSCCYKYPLFQVATFEDR